MVTPQMINFMSSEAKGLICVSITSERARELELDIMVKDSNAVHGTNFTVSVDYKHGTTRL